MKLAPTLALLRLNKPIGIWLLFFPAAWAVALIGDHDTGRLMLLMLLGAAITRSAGCILNDLADRTLDAQVARTRTRPLASGALTMRYALALLVLLLAAALALALSLPPAVFALALVALPMIAAYPWMKRLTWWPQLFLGLTFNLGALFGWLATGAPLSAPAFTLYAACMFWTLGYDTIYAIQDMVDDARVGIRSSARALGSRRIHGFVALCYGLMLALLALTGALLQVGVFYYIGLIALAVQLRWQIRALPCEPERAGSLFRSNRWGGLFFLLGLLLHRLV
ncbi:MAG: 4-hydroxybenzoate octaprenyltransferase [Alphaproteobacteria bacterium]|nr:4-hydroxybenzoate octaprenyltransferase [Alphaproteobacteria bacterium]